MDVIVVSSCSRRIPQNQAGTLDIRVAEYLRVVENYVMYVRILEHSFDEVFGFFKVVILMPILYRLILSIYTYGAEQTEQL